MKLKFWRPDYSETVDDADEFEIKHFDPTDDLDFAAEEYAEYYHSNRDGWECSWPIVFYIADEDGKFLGRVSVERESRPHFSGRLIEDKP